MRRAAPLLIALLLSACSAVRPRPDAPPREIEDAFLAAKGLEARGDLKGAIRAWRRFVEEFPGSAQEEEARFALTETLVRTGDPLSAHEEFQRLYRDRSSPSASRALERDLEMGLSLLLQDERFLGVKLGGRASDGVAILDDVKAGDAGGRFGLEAWAALGDYFLAARQHEDALYEYETLLEKFPETAHAREARAKRVLALAALCRPDGKGASFLEEARAAADEVLADGALPNDERRRIEEALREAAAVKAGDALKTARFYAERGRKDAARIYLEGVMRDHPGTGAAAEAAEMLRGLEGKDRGR